MKKLMKKMLGLALALSIVLGSSATMQTYAAGTTTKTYTINTGNTVVYSNTGLTKKYGTIYASDEITVISITSTYTKVSYPVSRGTKTGYIKTSSILSATGGNTYTARAKITAYKRPGGASYGYIAKNDKVVVLGTKGNYVQLRYPVSGGYKFAWVSKKDANNYIYQIDTGTTTEADVQKRLDKIANGTLTYDYKTKMKVNSTFEGTRATEQCKGYAKNVFDMCFDVIPGRTQNKPNNYMIENTSGMYKVGSVTSMTQANIKSLFTKAKAGDFVQIRRRHTGSHSAIVYSVSSTGVTFLEANTDSKNTVKKSYYTWAKLCTDNAAMSVYRASNYKLKAL
jgi:hypothetical protein